MTDTSNLARMALTGLLAVLDLWGDSAFGQDRTAGKAMIGESLGIADSMGDEWLPDQFVKVRAFIGTSTPGTGCGTCLGDRQLVRYSCRLGLPKVNCLGQMRRGDLVTPRHAEGAQSFARRGA